MADLPAHARAVVIGGGVVGCSVAYHLAKLGWSDVVLLERRRLTSGTTWHAAGLIGQLRATANLTRLAKYSAELYLKLEAETGQPTGFKRNGSLGLAHDAERLEELLRSASRARALGLEVREVTVAECRDLHPLLDSDGLAGGIFIPSDGQANPVDITLALAKGARAGGVRIFENTAVTGILVERGRAAGVRTAEGEVRADFVVNCAGMWGREVGRMAGVAVPLQACEHFYVLTEPMPGLPGNLPVLREPDAGAYYKEDAGKLLIGCFEPVAKPWAVDGIPEDAEFLELPEDWDHFMPILESAMRRIPALRSVGIRKFFNGPESFTPDDLYHLGEAPGLAGFFVACGFNSIGIQSAGGAGMVLAAWMNDGQPPMDLSEVDIRRAQPFQATRSYLRDRVSETLGLLYAMHWPHRQAETARGARTSPLHERLAARNAFFGQSAGWERPLWFAPPGLDPRPRYSWRRQNFFPWVAAEHMAVRRRAGVLDLTSMSKFLVEGPDALRLLGSLCSADIDRPVGSIVHSLWLNRAGGIEAEVTVTRWSETRFLVVSGSNAQVRDLAWLRRHLPDDARCHVGDVTSAWAVLAVAGPRSRDVLARVIGERLDDTAFPAATARQVEIGYAPVWAHRISSTGELGWELYMPTEMARHAFDRLIEAGDLVPTGFLALDSLRVETGHPRLGHDIGADDDPFAGGLDHAVRLDKPGGFVGRDAVLRRRERGLPSRRILHVALGDPEPLLYHDEPILRDGRIVGRLSSGAYGHGVGHAVGMGWVEATDGIDRGWVEAASWEIEIAGRRFPASASLDPPGAPRVDQP